MEGDDAGVTNQNKYTSEAGLAGDKIRIPLPSVLAGLGPSTSFPPGGPQEGSGLVGTGAGDSNIPKALRIVCLTGRLISITIIHYTLYQYSPIYFLYHNIYISTLESSGLRGPRQSRRPLIQQGRV